MPLTIALAGNPNCGKTTLFNRLTRSALRVGNRPGVTVEAAVARMCSAFGDADVTDLPGVYSLSSRSPEERLARDHILSAAPDVIVNVVDASHLERNLCLTFQLMQLGRPVVVALNMMDEVALRGGSVNAPLLAKRLGVPVVPVSARRGDGVDALMRCAFAAHTPPTPPSAHTPEERYRLAETVLRGCCSGNGDDAVTQRADRLLAASRISLPTVALVVALVLALSFGDAGRFLCDGFSQLVQLGCRQLGALLLRTNVSPALYSLVVDGVCGGVSSVLQFLPMLLTLFVLLALLEDSGYLARIVFLADAPLRRLGLSGHSFVPLLTGLGCTVPAVLSARVIPHARERRTAVLLVPFISCGARLPVYALLCSLFFPDHAALAVALLYAPGLLCALVGALLMRTKAHADAASSFMLELPPYRLPSAANVLRQTWACAKDFLSRAFSVVLLCSIAVWFLQRYTFGLTPAASSDQSMLCRIGSVLAPLFAPAGFGSPAACAALLTGLLAKENILGTLGVLCGSAVALRGVFPSPASAAAFLVFVSLYSPCIAALTAMRRELGCVRSVILAALLQTAVAWLTAVLVYHVGLLLC